MHTLRPKIIAEALVLDNSFNPFSNGSGSPTGEFCPSSVKNAYEKQSDKVTDLKREIPGGLETSDETPDEDLIITAGRANNSPALTEDHEIEPQGFHLSNTYQQI